MAGNELLKDPLEGLRDLCTAEMWGMGVEKVQEPPRRFEVGFFGSEGYQAVEALHRSNFDIETVGDFSTIRWFGPFARKYVTNPGHGCPFLTSSTMMEARPRAEKLVSIKHTRHLEALKVYEDYILISCSGTIGNVMLCTKDVDGWACSQDAIRVISQEPDHLGPLYCFLQSPLGQFLLQKNQTGSVVRHIYEADVSGLPVPRLPRALREELTRLVKQASSLRVEANHLLDKAEDLVKCQLRFPDIKEFLKARDTSTAHNATIFNVSVGAKIATTEKIGRCRFDATAHDPAAVALRKHILESKDGMLLDELVGDVRNSNLRKRVYVDDTDYGVPLLGGKNLMQLRPSDLNYLSKVHTKNLKHENVRQGWTLVSCGGTVGRTLMIERNYEDMVFTQDVMRIIPSKQCHPGFLYAFLASPYGQLQLLQESYGSVLKKLRDFHFRDLALRLPEDRGKAIHDLVVRGFDCRADALEIEDQAFALFMSAVKQGRQAIETRWGGKY